ncbi:PAS domain-containing protein [uncultured Thiodictyon sp.]|uniref:PAS domain-containing protein n=1 Tax=uncultured Thiodictyon sp. TaxID=1846217 RepID=UPI0025E91CB0|nr:PAS domain-containing protein [uncultured Thiodictyon sp.]
MFKRHGRAWLTAALALAALLGNGFNLPVGAGIHFLFGSIAVMLALAWRGTGAGVAVALVGGGYTWLLWGHPYSLPIFLAEAVAVGWHRDRARRRGLPPPPLAVSAALYWLLLGFALSVLVHQYALEMGWALSLLIALKQSQNGILNAALADLLLAGGAILTRRKAALPLTQILFGVLLAAMLLPTLLVNAWESSDLQERLETAQAQRLRLFGELAVQQPMALLPGADADPAALPAQLAVLRRVLTAELPASSDPQLRLERVATPVAPAPARPAAAPLTWLLGRQSGREQVCATATPGLSLILPGGRYPSWVARWRQARYRLEVPVPAADAPSIDWRLAIEVRAAPLIAQMQRALARFLLSLLVVTLLGLLVARDLSRRIARPLHQLAEASLALPAAIREGRPWPTPVPGPLAETGELADAVTEMAESLAANFLALREERDQRASVNLALYRQEGRYRLVVENIEDLIIRVDVRGRFKYVSPSYCHTFGRTESELIGTLDLPPIHPDDRLPTKTATASLFHPPHTMTVELRNRTIRGWRWFQWSGRAVLAAQDRVIGIVAVGRDVTDRKAAERGLLESEQRERQARLTLEHTQESLLKAQTIARLGSWECDVVTDRLYWSPEEFRIFGQDPERFDPCYAAMLAIVHPEDRALLDRVYRESVANRTPYELVHRLLLPDGRIAWVHERGQTEYAADGAPLNSRGTTQDITERYLAQERLRASEAAITHYNLQLEELVDVISLPLPPAEQLTRLLRLGCDSLGGTAAVVAIIDEEQGYSDWCMVGDAVPPPLERPVIEDALTHPGSPCALGADRLSGAASAAGWRCGVVMAFVAPRPDGRIESLLLSLWGVTPALDLSGPGPQIIRLIAQRIAAVRYQEQAQGDLVAANGRETIGHLASGIAHDFNNLLGVIDANIYYLEARIGGLVPTDGELRQVFAETQSALGQAKVITSGMLSLSRAGGLPLEWVELAPTVAELERILRQVLPVEIDLRVGVAAGLRVWSNGAFLQSALLNLAFNARDAMPEGGVLVIEAQPIHWDGDGRAALAVGQRPSVDCIVLRVSDNGSGIAPSLLPRIFDPLFSTKAKQRGHGLGLFMVQEFVTRSGAGLAVESQPGRGTCFSLLLSREPPVARAGAGAATTAPPVGGGAGSAVPLAGLRVLVVDDDARVREAVGRLLRVAGARLGQAEHGEACLALLARDAAFDLVLSDIAMPVLDGIALLQRLATQRPGLPVILMTGQKDALSALDELSERPTVLRKPVDPAALCRAILAKTGASAH